MYTCDFCNKQTASGEPQRLVTTRTRAVVYYKYDHRTREHTKEVEGKGVETVKEERSCTNCAKEVL